MEKIFLDTNTAQVGDITMDENGRAVKILGKADNGFGGMYFVEPVYPERPYISKNVLNRMQRSERFIAFSNTKTDPSGKKNPCYLKTRIKKWKPLIQGRCELLCRKLG